MLLLLSSSVVSDCNTMDCSLPGSTVHEISQARILEWVAISSSRGSSRPKDQTYISWTIGGFFTPEPFGSLEKLYQTVNRHGSFLSGLTFRPFLFFFSYCCFKSFFFNYESIMVKNLPAMWEDLGSVPGSGTSSVEGNGNSFQYSCLGNLMDRGALWVIFHGAAESYMT